MSTKIARIMKMAGFALAPSVGSQTYAADPVTDAMQEAYVPYRVALFKIPWEVAARRGLAPDAGTRLRSLGNLGCGAAPAYVAQDAGALGALPRRGITMRG